ncbi:MAG: Glycosyltransferase family 2 protein [uncultured Sulfurovum sp.]|uniref:Glycosyltransferase family 2 protein n=1 Tax=uncultured Sulfurovum sp. TaxID=269237 RepID=A0A6S6TPP5_9BACT|nr:MAG: Glycosyltransferase family 2 protein [uncultured Sulfurovum sp.]
MIKFSVVIPLYNKEKDIIDTITSVMNQDYKADEIIVVDDGSTDNAIKLIKEKFQDNTYVVSQENLGVSSARNRGISEAKNEYICLLDGDDIWEKEFLEEIAQLIELYPKAIFYSTAHKYINEEGNYLKAKLSFVENKRGILENFVEIFRKNYGLLNSSSVCIRKSSEVVFPKNEDKGEDLCVWLELGVKGSLAFSAKALSTYRLNASNRSSTIDDKGSIPCPLKWFYKNKEELKKEKNYKSIQKFIYSNIFITVYGGFVLSGNYSSITAVIKLMKEHNDWFFVCIYPAYLVPISFLEVIKKMRREIR